MLNSAILEVIIGMIFVFSLLSILVTQINNIIDSVIKLRSDHLKWTLREMITDPPTLAQFLTHPLICLVKAPVDPNQQLSAQQAQKVSDSQTTNVTWIQPQVFAEVMTDLMQAQSGAEGDVYAPLTRAANQVLNNAERAQIQALVRQLETSGVGFEELRQVIQEIKTPADREVMQQVFTNVDQAMREFKTESGELIALLKGVQRIQNPDFQRAMYTLIGNARTIDGAKLKLQQWFERQMNHASETYRRRMGWISLGVGLLIAFVLNVDSLALAQSLWNDSALRETVVLAAQSSLDSGNLVGRVNTPPLVGDTPTIPEATAEPGVETTPEPSFAGVQVEQAQAQVDQSVEIARDTIQDLLGLRLPIGWDFQQVDTSTELGLNELSNSRIVWNLLPIGSNPDWLSALVAKLIGLAITTLAIAQGAPFWFDLLNRIARGGQRSSG